MNHLLKLRPVHSPEFRSRLADALGVISLFVLLGCVLHLPLLA